MGQIQRLTRGQAKPYASLPRIDTAHPLASGLLFYGYDIGNAVIDLVRNVQSAPDVLPPNYSTGMSKYGPGVLYPNGIANGGLSIPSTAAIRAVAPPFTWATGCTQTVASPTNSFNRIWGRTANDGSPAPFENWCFQANVSGTGTNVRAGWSVNSSTEGDSATWNSLVANQFTSLLAQFTTSTNVDFYAQGVKQNSTTTSYSSTNTNDNIRYGSPGPATGLGQSFPGFVFYGAFWNRKLSPAEILLLHQDPYCFLIYPEDEMLATLVGVVAGGPVALVGAGMSAAAGSFANAVAITIGGASISAAAGALSVKVTPGFLGAAASASAGTLAETIAVALAGAPVTAAAGTFGGNANLTGAGANAAAGIFAEAIASALSGAGATSSAGAFTEALSDALTGAGAALSAGAFAGAVTEALASAGMSSAAGTFIDALADALSGAAASSAAGLFAEAVLDALTGAAAASSAGSFSVSTSSGGTVSLPGAGAASAAGSFADAVTRALTGASAASAAGTISASNALNLAIAGASANALAGSVGVTEKAALPGAAVASGAGSFSETLSDGLSGASGTVAAGTFSRSEAALFPGAAIAALAGLIRNQGSRQATLLGAFAQASAGILLVSAISNVTLRRLSASGVFTGETDVPPGQPQPFNPSVSPGYVDEPETSYRNLTVNGVVKNG